MAMTPLMASRLQGIEPRKGIATTGKGVEVVQLHKLQEIEPRKGIATSEDVPPPLELLLVARD